MTVEVANPLVGQLVNPAARPPHYAFSFDDFLKREYRFGISSDRPGEPDLKHIENHLVLTRL